jgi:tellurite resistance protein
MVLGGYQVYLGWRFIDRRSRIASEKVEYVWATASVLGLIAVIDGELSAKDKEIIRAAYARAGFSDAEIREVELTLSDCERTFVSGGSDPDRLFNMLRDACAKVSLHSNQQTRFIFLETAVALVGSDGFISSAEEKALRAAALMLGFSSEDVDKVRAMAHQPDAPAPAI